jgi:uncharacterized protein (TIGR03437 family)
MVIAGRAPLWRAFNTRPAKVGEVVELYGVGFGPTDPLVISGHAFSGAVPTDGPVNVTVGGVAASVQFSGLVSAGLYQLNVVVPNGTGSGDQLVRATVGGAQTQENICIAVK